MVRVVTVAEHLPGDTEVLGLNPVSKDTTHYLHA